MTIKQKCLWETSISHVAPPRQPSWRRFRCFSSLCSLKGQYKLGSLATEFLAGSNNNDLEFLRVRTSNNQYHQLIADANGIRLDSINGSTNTTRWQAALKGDLTDYIKVMYFDNTINMAANGSGTISIPFSVPSGYRLLTLANAHAEGFEIATFNLYTSGSNIIVNIRNLVNEALTKRVVVTALFAKS